MIIIPIMMPLAMRGVEVKAIEPQKMLRHNLLLFGIGGLIVPFIGIKLIDILMGRFL